MTYSGMACGHTTIGAERFHFRVRNGIGWFPLAIAARQTVLRSMCRSVLRDRLTVLESIKFFASTHVAFEYGMTHSISIASVDNHLRCLANSFGVNQTP